LYICRAAELKCKEDTKELSQLIHLVDTAPGFSAMGLFDVEKKTLTTIFGTILTYLIITIQFQMGNNQQQNN
jgi:hypothetical protein